MLKFLNQFEKFLYWALLFLLIFIPLLPKYPLFGVQGTFVSIRTEDFVVALILLLGYSYLFLSRKVLILLKDPLIQAIVLFFFIGLVSLFSANFLTHTVTHKLSLLHYLRRVELILLFPLAYVIFSTKRQVVTALKVLGVTVLLVTVYAFGQQYLHWPVFSTTNSEFSKGQVLYLTPGARANSTFAGHYDLGAFLAMVLIVLVPVTLTYKKIQTRVFLGGLGILSFVVLIMTAARQSFVAAMIGILLTLWLLGKRMLIGVLFLLVLGALIYPSQLRDRLFSTLTVNVLQQGERYEGKSGNAGQRDAINIPTIPNFIATSSSESSRSASASSHIASDIAPGEPLDTTQLGVYRSFEIRLKVEWPRAIRAFLKNPLLGTGYSSLELATDNDILRSLGEVGLLGTMAFAFVLIALIRRLIRLSRSGDKFIHAYALGITAMVIAFILNATFIDVFEASKLATLFWLVTGLSLGLEKEKNV